ncbi:hypothetical protein I6A84_11735 [Frankia sp. CNm7]|uniref:Uncharacterized protein n=1 Tax=Frankia nepalensis TaxID=1836974 RepID=A0A937RC62_9ACTN|nr:hypothetical protein [Frankia nepalensis]MBL7495371.1 hypothetical protein [Frankia nepalensis]MBL7515866.1 hypothetical protein [Frankia nepalensis]MBL7518764.1 hypothetical protein [Frankia nepalensis]MBL7627740.1 hypothetical protein [Frankia nepalensis]
MRKSRMRAATAGVLGAAMIAIAGPAWAAGSPSPSPEPSPTSTVTPTATPTQGLVIDVPNPLATGTATPTPTATPTATGTATPDATPTGEATTSASPSPTTAPGVIVIPGIGEIDLNFEEGCETFNSFSPIKVPCEAEIDGIEDFVPNPLLITATCGPNGPDWKVTNTGTKALGYGWFDINLGGGIALIGPGETQTINSHSIAVIASPWDAATSTLLVAIPAVGYSTCPGAPAVPAIPASLPGATPAVAVPGTPYYTG